MPEVVKETDVKGGIRRQITIAGQIRFNGDLMALVRIDPSTLDTSLRDQASTRLFLGLMKADAKQQVDLLDARLDALKARLFGEYKNSGGEKAPSDTTTEKMMKADPQVLAAAESLAEATGTYSLCCEVCAAMDDRREMLINLSANERKEEHGVTPSVPGGAARSTRTAIDEARAAREAKEADRAANQEAATHAASAPPPESNGTSSPVEPEQAPAPAQTRRVPARK